MKLFEKLAEKYPTPEKVQHYLYGLKYNREKDGETQRSALSAYRKKTVHCLEATLIAAAILEHKGYPPLILYLDSQDDLGHVIFVFKAKTGWGSVARSRDFGLHGRKPYFRSIRDLALSYYDPYIDKTGMVVGYKLLNLNESGTDWRFSARNLWKLEQYIVTAKHIKVKSSKQRYRRLHARYLAKGELRSGKHWWFTD